MKTKRHHLLGALHVGVLGATLVAWPHAFRTCPSEPSGDHSRRAGDGRRTSAISRRPSWKSRPAPPPEEVAPPPPERSRRSRRRPNEPESAPEPEKVEAPPPEPEPEVAAAPPPPRNPAVPRRRPQPPQPQQNSMSTMCWRCSTSTAPRPQAPPPAARVAERSFRGLGAQNAMTLDIARCAAGADARLLERARRARPIPSN